MIADEGLLQVNWSLESWNVSMIADGGLLQVSWS